MVYAPNANWTTAASGAQQAPVYFLRIDGMTATDYSTAAVRSAATTKSAVMALPEGGAVTLDFLDGHRGVQTARVALLDVSGAITDLVATDAADAVLSTLINRRATIYGGYRDLDESDYAAIFTGRITGLAMLDDLTGYDIELSDMSYLLDGDVCADATDSAPSVIEGNPVNIYWALLSGTFSTTHSDFPLARVSGQVTTANTSSDYGTDLAWTNPGNAYDGNAATIASGQASSSTASSVVFSFASAAQSCYVRVSGYVEAGATMALHYSVDGGTTWVQFGSATDTSATDYDSSLLHLDDTADLRVRATIAAGAGTPNGYISEIALLGSAPTGLGIASADINETQLIAERDRWHPDDVVRVTFVAPENAASHLRDEFFRVFQAWPAISQDGRIGLRFHVPALPATSATALTEADLAGPPTWKRLFDAHLNRFVYRGDYDIEDRGYPTLLYSTETAEDTADQSATGETITFDVESRWLRTDVANTYGETGADIAADLAGRVRIRYLKTPAEVEVPLHFTRRAIEEGDIVALTHRHLPNLLAGTRGLTAHHMTVMSVRPDYARGVLLVTLLDTGLRRYGTIAPAAQGDYTAATAQEQGEYAWISNDSGAMSNGDQGYRTV